MVSSDFLPAATGVLAAGIAQTVCSDEELALIAAIFTQLGDSLALILAARQREKSCQSE